MNHGMEQKTQRIYQDVTLLALDLFARIIAMRIDAGPPFSALLTLWLSMIAGGGAGFAFRLLAACDVERLMNEIQHAIALPPDEIAVDRAVRRKVLRQIAPLATGTQDIHHPVHDRPHVGPALATAGLGRRN